MHAARHRTGNRNDQRGRAKHLRAPTARYAEACDHHAQEWCGDRQGPAAVVPGYHGRQVHPQEDLDFPAELHAKTSDDVGYQGCIPHQMVGPAAEIR